MSFLLLLFPYSPVATNKRARPLHNGRRFSVLETELTRADGALAAKVTQTQAYNFPQS